MYQRHEQRMLAGSLNLSAPCDLIPDSDSIALQNFRVEPSGALRPRLAASSIGVNLTGWIHTIYRSGNDRWFVSDGTLYKGTTAIETGFDGNPMNLVTEAGSLWVMNRGKQGRVDNPSTSPVFRTWLPDAPATLAAITPVAGGSLSVNDTYRYWVTFLTADGQETNPSPDVSFSPTSANRTAQLARPTSTDVRITSGGFWCVYRMGDTVEDAYRVAKVAYATTTFDDTGDGDYSDLEITRLGIVMEQNHGAPPAASILVGPHYGRLFAASSAAYPNRVWYTPVNKPWMWDPDAWFDCGDAGDEIVMMSEHRGSLRIYKKRSVWRLRGDPKNGVVERTSASFGLIGMKAIATEGAIDYIQGQEGIYACDGDRDVRLSAKLDPLFRTGLAMPTGKDPDLQALHDSETLRAKNCLAVRNGRLYFSYCNVSAGSIPNQVITCDLATGNWAHAQAPSPTQPAGWTALYDEGQYSELLGAGPLGVIYALEQALPETNAFQLRWTSGFRDQGVRERKKRYADLVIEHGIRRSAPANRDLTVKVKLDSGETADVSAGTLSVATTAASGATRETAVIPFGTSNRGVHARNLAVLLEGTCESDIAVYSVTLHYYVEPRDARTFDTGTINCGDPRVKTFDLLELDILSNDTVTWDVLTDLPGSLASRQTSTFAATTTRLPVGIPLNGFDGRIAQLQLTSPGVFWLYGARLRYRVTSVYLEGAKGQSHTTSVLMPAAA